MPKDATARLHDALSACRELEPFVAGQSLADYETNNGLRRIVERLIEITGEATRQALHFEPELEQQIPRARAIIATRHRIAHGYDELEDDVVWDIATVGMPQLADIIGRILEERGPPE